MADSHHSLAALKRQIAALDRAPARAMLRVPTGHGGLDMALGDGLALGCVHELFGDTGEDGAVAGLALLWAWLAAAGAPVLWLRTQGAARIGGVPYGPGLAALGLDPEMLLTGVMTDDAMVLRAAIDGLRCQALGGVVIELRGRAPLLDLTASRRLALAAEASGVTAMIVRLDATPVPSAAETRWHVAAAPSVPLPGNAPGSSAFDLTLLRCRTGRDGQRWRLTWDGQRGSFGDWVDERHDDGQRSDDRPAPLSGALLPLPAGRPPADHAARSVGGRRG
ncbi:protein ImuA [Sphingobium sp. OAS761]|uniref:ImuA family protein n=1 Tax=Sphingobium sp. OAS761 TaxID=2817901 RepID=UPI0020A13DB7|nr:hypothetical protein [Sphingobium sp. OAS761]MCP1471806.1 protein ImuA [Sphingobium sp. OAS761]